MSTNFIYTVDVESDLHTNSEDGISTGLIRFESLCDKHKVKPVLFLVASLIPRHATLLKRFHNKGWEISLHGLTHKRFDDLSFKEKEHEITESIKIFKRYLGFKPKGFRAPQHSVDDDTLFLLEKYGFEYDSSYTPLNLLQLLFFPKRFIKWAKHFISPRNYYKIRKNLIEKPCSSLLLPFVSLTLRVLPRPLTSLYLSLIKYTYNRPVFYAHSWDFIKMPKSKIDNVWPYTALLRKLDFVMATSKG